MFTIPILLMGCGNVDKMNLLIQDNNEKLIQSIREQATANTNSRKESMEAFSKAMTTAASTVDRTDDVAISMAWGFSMGQPNEVIVPNLQKPERAKDAGDYAREFAFLLPYVDLWLRGSYDNKEYSPSISASGGSTVLYQSANPSGDDNFLPILSEVDQCKDGTCGDLEDDLIDDPETEYYDPGGFGCSSYESYINGFCTNQP